MNSVARALLLVCSSWRLCILASQDVKRILLRSEKLKALRVHSSGRLQSRNTDDIEDDLTRKTADLVVNICANEGGTCSCDGRVFFGRRFVKGRSGNILGLAGLRRDAHETRKVRGQIRCSSDAFGGDPKVNKAKHCLCLPDSDNAGKAMLQELDRSADFCAGEGDVCRCAGTVFFGRRYGDEKGGRQLKFQALKEAEFKVQRVDQEIRCNSNDFGGDPQVNRPKQCLCQGYFPGSDMPGNAGQKDVGPVAELGRRNFALVEVPSEQGPTGPANAQHLNEDPSITEGKAEPVRTSLFEMGRRELAHLLHLDRPQQASQSEVQEAELRDRGGREGFHEEDREELDSSNNADQDPRAPGAEQLASSPYPVQEKNFFRGANHDQRRAEPDRSWHVAENSDAAVHSQDDREPAREDHQQEQRLGWREHERRGRYEQEQEEPRGDHQQERRVGWREHGRGGRYEQEQVEPHQGDHEEERREGWREHEGGALHEQEREELITLHDLDKDRSWYSADRDDHEANTLDWRQQLYGDHSEHEREEPMHGHHLDQDRSFHTANRDDNIRLPDDQGDDLDRDHHAANGVDGGAHGFRGHYDEVYDQTDVPHLNQDRSWHAADHLDREVRYQGRGENMHRGHGASGRWDWAEHEHGGRYDEEGEEQTDAHHLVQDRSWHAADHEDSKVRYQDPEDNIYAAHFREDRGGWRDHEHELHNEDAFERRTNERHSDRDRSWHAAADSSYDEAHYPHPLDDVQRGRNEADRATWRDHEQLYERDRERDGDDPTNYHRHYFQGRSWHANDNQRRITGNHDREAVGNPSYCADEGQMCRCDGTVLVVSRMTGGTRSFLQELVSSREVRKIRARGEVYCGQDGSSSPDGRSDLDVLDEALERKQCFCSME